MMLKMSIVPITSNQLDKLFVTVPRAPMITGTTSTLQHCQIRFISYFRSWYLATFSSSFSLHPGIKSTCNVNENAFFLHFLVNCYVRS